MELTLINLTKEIIKRCEYIDYSIPLVVEGKKVDVHYYYQSKDPVHVNLFFEYRGEIIPGPQLVMRGQESNFNIDNQLDYCTKIIERGIKRVDKKLGVKKHV